MEARYAGKEVVFARSFIGGNDCGDLQQKAYRIEAAIRNGAWGYGRPLLNQPRPVEDWPFLSH
jgi:hypothetical protein